MTDFVNNGFSERLPIIRPRYYNPESFGGNDGRGAVASLRLLNVKQNSINKAKGVEREILNELVRNNGYTNFLLQNVSFQDSEKSQVMHTFGDGYVNYFYGRNPRQMSLSGTLIDDIDNDWFYRFLVAYDKFLRGTSLARNYRLIQLTLPNVVLVGTVLDFAYSQDANNDNNVSFSMNFLIKEMDYISSRATKTAPTGVNGIFTINPTSKDFATLTNAEISRRVANGIATSATASGLDSDQVANLANLIQGNSMVLSSSEDYQSIYRAFAGYYKIDNFAAGPKISGLGQSMFSAFSDSEFGKQSIKLYEKTLSDAKKLLEPVKNFIKKVTDGIASVTNFFKNIVSEIYSLTQFFNGIPNQIFSLVNTLLSPLRALLEIPNAISSVVYSVKLIKDAVVQSLDRIKNTFKEVSQVFANSRAALFSAPDTFAAKLSAGSAVGEFQSTGSLGSVTSNVVSADAVAVLQLLNSRNEASFSSLASTENTVSSLESLSVISL